MCLKENELDPAHFLSASGLVWQACSKKTEIKLELLTDNEIMLLTDNAVNDRKRN